MKMLDVKKLKEGCRVNHRHFGECVVKEVMMSGDDLFGVVLKPDNENGKSRIRQITGGHNAPFLESSIRLLKLPQVA